MISQSLTLKITANKNVSDITHIAKQITHGVIYFLHFNNINRTNLHHRGQCIYSSSTRKLSIYV